MARHTCRTQSRPRTRTWTTTTSSWCATPILPAAAAGYSTSCSTGPTHTHTAPAHTHTPPPRKALPPTAFRPPFDRLCRRATASGAPLFLPSSHSVETPRPVLAAVSPLIALIRAAGWVRLQPQRRQCKSQKAPGGGHGGGFCIVLSGPADAQGEAERCAWGNFPHFPMHEAALQPCIIHLHLFDCAVN